MKQIADLICRLLLIAFAVSLPVPSIAAAQCAAKSSSPEYIPATTVAAAKASLKLKLSSPTEKPTLTEAQKVLFDGINIVQKKKHKDSGEVLAETIDPWLSNSFWVIYTDPILALARGPGQSPDAQPAPAVVEALLVIVLEHEFWHLDQDSSGVPSGEGSDVPGGDTDCKHLGLQFHTVIQSCKAAEVAATPEIRAALCRLLKGAREVLVRRKNYVRECHVAEPSASAGPPDWGLPYNPFPPSQYRCEVCGDE